MERYLERNNQLWLVILCLTAFVTVYLSPVNYGGSDPRGTLMTSQAILQMHTLALDAYGDNAKGYQYGQFDGHVYYGYPLGAVILALPFVWLANLKGMDMQNINDDDSVQKAIAAVIVALACLLIYLLCRSYVDYTHSFLLSIAFVFGSSIASTVGAALWSVDFQTLFILVILVLLVYHDQQRLERLDPLLMGVLLFLTYLCRPTGAVFIAVILGYLFLKQRSIFVPTLATVVVLFAGLIALYMAVYHQPLSPYYGGVSFYSLPSSFPLAIYAQFLSPSRGILILSPYLFITVVGAIVYFRELRQSSLFWMLVIWLALHLIVVCLNPNFWGGSSYGNRLYADAFPGVIVVSLLVWRCLLKSASVEWRETVTSLLIVLILFSVFVHTAQGLYNPLTATWNRNIDQGNDGHLVLDWQHPQFLASPQMLASLGIQ